MNMTPEEFNKIKEDSLKLAKDSDKEAKIKITSDQTGLSRLDYNPENHVKYREYLQEAIESDNTNEYKNDALVDLYQLVRIDETLNNNADWFDYINCHAYALGLTENPHISMAKKFLDSQEGKSRKILTNSSFMSHIIKEEYLTKILDQDKPKTGNIVIYFEEGKVIHSGIMREGKVESKLGLLAVFRHDLLQVPSSYGSDIQYFNLSKSPNELTKILKKWLYSKHPLFQCN